ncbi:MAG TPA: HAMP domain-containing sensor histidine kinase [Bacillales bacterium]|nr:HAMP domain-containing sensor histidine kinase [Bacillales bacterium]
MTALNLTLTQRIWMSFMLLVLFVGVVIAVVYPISIKDALTEQSYKIIEDQQLNFDPSRITGKSQQGFIESRNAARSVSHLIVTKQETLLRGDPVPNKVLKKMGKNASKQKGEMGEYQLTYQDATLFYVIRKITFNGNPAFMISYMWDTYRNNMIRMLWERLLLILLIVGVLSIAPAYWLARYLRKPLIMLGNRFEEIAKRNWETSFQWGQEDEFRHLSDQFEYMRQNLLRYDRSQKTFIQHASHELKTPIMIINSYAQSVKDGILPKADLGETMNVIISESNRMEQRVKELIYYTKLDTLKDETPQRSRIRFGPLAMDVVERLQIQREDLSYSLNGEDTLFEVDKEKWKVLIENLVENAMRYAKSEIRMEASANSNTSILSVYNDGETIPDEERLHLFDPFFKGEKGKFGLGLAIVRRIVELHDGEISVVNESDGVRFVVKVPRRVRPARDKAGEE